MTAREIFSTALAKLRRFVKRRKLAGIERDLELMRAERDEIHAAEAYLQREAMFLRCDLNR